MERAKILFANSLSADASEECVFCATKSRLRTKINQENTVCSLLSDCKNINRLRRIESCGEARSVASENVYCPLFHVESDRRLCKAQVGPPRNRR